MTTPDASTLIATIRQRMAEMQLSQAELAERIGSSAPTISMYLAGRKRPGLDVIDRMLIALDLDPAKMLRR